MSQENVEIVKAAIDAFNRKDWDDATFQDAAPGFEFDMSRSMGPERGIYRLDQARRFFEEFAASWESVRFDPHEFIEAGDLVVVPQPRTRRDGTGSRWWLAPPLCGRYETERSCEFPCTRSGRMPSKPWGCWSKTLAPTPEPAGYCAVTAILAPTDPVKRVADPVSLGAAAG